jgi:hypothetical protein
MATHLFHWLEKQFSTLAVFRVPNFQGRFEALNDVFGNFGPKSFINELAWASKNVLFSAIPFQ